MKERTNSGFTSYHVARFYIPYNMTYKTPYSYKSGLQFIHQAIGLLTAEEYNKYKNLREYDDFEFSGLDILLTFIDNVLGWEALSVSSSLDGSTLYWTVLFDKTS